jgi:hypothetical protein
VTERPAPSVRKLLADLHAYRLKTMAPADLQVNIDQRALLERTPDRSAFVQAGDVVEPFTLPEVHGGTPCANSCPCRLEGWSVRPNRKDRSCARRVHRHCPHRGPIRDHR